MNRNGYVKIIKARIGNPDYTLDQAKQDIESLIDAYEDLFDQAKEMEKDNRYWSNR